MKQNDDIMPWFDTSRFAMLPLSRIEPNEGQLPGLPSNPRQIQKRKFEKLKANIEHYPEMLVARSLLVYPLDDSDSPQYIIIGGNMRYRAMSELGHTEAPVFIIPRAVTVERLQAYTILDNNGFGDWDWDLLANEWQEDDLNDWGVNIPERSCGEDDLSESVSTEYKIEIDCGDESTQEELYATLTDQGYKCRLVTL